MVTRCDADIAPTSTQLRPTVRKSQEGALWAALSCTADGDRTTLPKGPKAKIRGHDVYFSSDAGCRAGSRDAAARDRQPVQASPCAIIMAGGATDQETRIVSPNMAPQTPGTIPRCLPALTVSLAPMGRYGKRPWQCEKCGLVFRTRLFVPSKMGQTANFMHGAGIKRWNRNTSSARRGRRCAG